MFAAQHQSLLRHVNWRPEQSQGLCFIETTDEEPARLLHGYLADAGVPDWVRANSCPPGSPPLNSKSGGFRLLFCERSELQLEELQSRELYMSLASFTLVEEAFHLTPATVQALFTLNGLHSRFTERDAAANKIKYLQVLIQGRRKIGVADCVLSLCHCCVTGWTYGFICGERVVHPSQTINVGPLRHVLLDLLDPCLHLRSHVLLIPVMLLKVFTDRINLFIQEQIVLLDEMEDEIGVARTYRVKKTRSLENWPDGIDVKKVTIGLHSTGTELYYSHRTCLWTYECLEFLCKLAADCSDYIDLDRTTDLEVQQAIEYETTRMKWIGRTVETSKERVEAQLNVLYSAASQKENAIAIKYSQIAQEQNKRSLRDAQMNTRIATSTKRDSIAMTTFTFITAVFLPGTYVSSLFSMSMFDWLPSEDDGGETPRVSTKFYAYWCITVPLTVLVMAGWLMWYKRADRAWQKETGYRLNDNAGANQQLEEGLKSDG
ncbi:hypothetical protein PV04_05343 [Phialophora macrospora]|uniref:Uncharacterized protein n=1 Tax=Phialophora macrospora TaxID=1851006 RepID=A0A0D2E569_9EURO|nr:hypothetical protein PV04_05343 [Phialophora macrospora]